MDLELIISTKKHLIVDDTMRLDATGWQRCRKCLISIGLFPHTRPMISGSFAERDLHLKASYASSPPCIILWGKEVVFIVEKEHVFL